MIQFSEHSDSSSNILAIGIGSAGYSVIDKINKYNIKDITTILIDSDTTLVKNSTAREKFCVSAKLIKESASDATAVLANQVLTKEIKPIIDGLPKSEIVFVISGLGGNTGTFITPIVAQLLKERSMWSWVLTTIPFFFEGKPKIINSLKKLKLIHQSANAVMAVPHDKVFKMVDKGLSMKEAFTPADNLFAELIVGIRRLTSSEGGNKKMGIKFNDIKNKIIGKRKTVNQYSFSTSFGIGEGIGEERLNTAIEHAVTSPLLGKEMLISAECIILGINGGEDIKLDEVNKGIESLHKFITKEKNIIFGLATDSTLGDSIKVQIIAMGVDSNSAVDNNWDLSMQSDTTGIKPQGMDLVGRVARVNRQMQLSQKEKQTMIDFKKFPKGQFEKSDATMFGGEDLDTPTFMRKKK